jgi:processive 1,2-diacylglycerol beta-glucosyltransferase
VYRIGNGVLTVDVAVLYRKFKEGERMSKRVLFLYLTKHSGHYAAALAVEHALRQRDANIESMLLDSFSHANPVLSKMTFHAYLAMLKTAPEIWEFMYDNPEFKQRTAKIRELLNRGSSKKLQEVLASFAPDAVVCTQAFSCGVVASWKRASGNRKLALVGVLTDFVAHRYWADDEVDLYIAPNDETKESLLGQGVPADRIRVTGIPIASPFIQPGNKNAALENLKLKPDVPKIVVMGGSLGLGPIKSVIRKLDALPQPFDIVVATGKNRRLRNDLLEKRRPRRHTTRVLGFVENLHELMDVAEVLVTKPGGITTAEALSKHVPMIIINPIPGQEEKNAQFLLTHHAAVQAVKASDVARYVDEFLHNPEKLRQLRDGARVLARPQAALEAAHAILEVLAEKGRMSG